MTTKSVAPTAPLSFKMFKPSERKYKYEENQTQPKIERINTSKTNKETKLWFTKDKAFLKFLTLVNLESKDKEWIAISRLLAYSILNQLKKENSNEKEVFKGIAYGLQQVLEYFDKNHLKVDNEDILSKACSVFSKDNTDIHKLVSFLIGGEEDKYIIFTKEITEKPSEWNVALKYGIFIDAGYHSHTFINDQLNYRVDMHHPIIYISDKLTMENTKSVIKFGLMKRTDIIFISNNVDSEVQNYIISKNHETQTGISLLKLSGSNSESDSLMKLLSENLTELTEISGKLKLKTSERVVMESNSTTIIDSSFFLNDNIQALDWFKQVVDIHLRSYNEAWINKFKNDVTEVYANVKDSKIGILPDLITSLYFASNEIKKLISDNSKIWKGIEIVYNSINTYTLIIRGKEHIFR